MFLDGQLRALAADRQRLALRGDLKRRLAQLEWRIARGCVRRTVSDLTLGMTLAERLIGFLRGR